MKIIDRYIGKTVIETTLLVVLMLTVVTIFISLLQEISTIGTGDYGIFAAIEYAILTLPQQVYSFFPMAALVGVSLGLGILANHSELTVMRASGVSLTKITFAVMKASIVLLLIATILGEWVGPTAEHFAENQKDLLTNKSQTLVTSQGIWIRDGNNYIYINQLLNNDLIKGVSRYEFDKDNSLVSASYAEAGIYKDKTWHMMNIATSLVSLNGIQTKQDANEIWNLSINPKFIRISAIDPSEMTLHQLFDYLLYLKINKLNTSSYALSFWQRILQPFATLVMVWLAIPFAFGQLRNASMGLRLMAGITLGFGFYILNEFFGPISIVYQTPPFLAALIPMLIFAGAAYFLQKQVE